MNDGMGEEAPGEIDRRSFLKAGAAACVLAARPARLLASWKISDGRPQPADRNFTSTVIEETIVRVRRQIVDPVLGAMFACCFPNTLDTTVFPGTWQGHPDTFVITGDIDAMWLRDSSAQVWPYLRFAKQDQRLAALLEGVVRRQTQLILIDPYANAFLRSKSDRPLPWAVNDNTTMKPGVGERKWEVDSLCHTIRLAHGYWSETGDRSPFDEAWKAAAWKIVETFREQQRLTSRGPYSFTRRSINPTETLALNGYGNPARSVGMIYSMFRPSDDACTYPLFLPANLFAARALSQLRELAMAAGDAKLAETCGALATTVQAAATRYGVVQHPIFGEIWAYEVDGYGNALMMDDANAPGLLSLPCLDCCQVTDPLYQRTRRFVLSRENPWYFEGKAAQGGGSPHTGPGKIWPMSILLRALTSTNEGEIRECLRWIRNTTAGTNFIHESFDENDPAQFTRPWFAWANTLFGELILNVAESRPALLRESFA
jgi:hypothetical protein